VQGVASFYTVRILLGVAEAGFFPGIIYYMTRWFPTQQRTRAIATFMSGNAVAGIVINPMSGTITQYLDGMAGLHGWQWVFFLECIPSIALGFCVMHYLTDRPEDAHWLNDDERTWLSAQIRQEDEYREQAHGADFRRTLSDPRVWILVLLYFAIAFGSNSASLFLPELIRKLYPQSKEVAVGFIASVPNLCGLIAMLINGAWADRTGKHRLHVAIPGFVSALGWILAAYSTTAAGGLVGYSLGIAGIMCMLPTFWSLPTSFLSGAAAAGGIALINSFGNLGGLAGPAAIGLIHERDKSASYVWGLVTLAFVMLLGALLALVSPHDTMRHETVA
jgi:MFS transporter, ACS family, tartrate transporter